MKRLGVWSVWGLLAGLAGCATSTQTATLLHFTEQEPGDVPYQTRMMLTARYLRLDEGPQSSGFVILDRAAGKVMSVSPGDQTVLVIEPLPLALDPPTVFEHSTEATDERFPAIAGKDVRHHRLFTNGAACGDVYAAAGLLPDAVVAWRQYHEILAGEQSITEARMPAELRSVCNQADLIFTPGRFLAHGFPVRRIEHNGRRRQLMNFEQVPVQPEWFSIPADYKHYHIGEPVP